MGWLLPSLYQTSSVVRATSTSFELSVWKSNRFTPGNKLARCVHRASHGDHAASTPLTRTLRVSMACELPDRFTVGRVVYGIPFEADSEYSTVRVSGICERTVARRAAAKFFMLSMVSVVGPQPESSWSNSGFNCEG